MTKIFMKILIVLTVILSIPVWVLLLMYFAALIIWEWIVKGESLTEMIQDTYYVIKEDLVKYIVDEIKDIFSELDKVSEETES